jgi:hypothetical protein
MLAAAIAAASHFYIFIFLLYLSLRVGCCCGLSAAVGRLLLRVGWSAAAGSVGRLASRRIVGWVAAAISSA